MTRTEAKAFQSELNRTLENIFKKYNLQSRRSSISFNDREVKVSITMEQLDSVGNHKADAYTEAMLRRHLENKGYKNLPETLVGSKFHILGQNGTFTLTGYNARAKEYPVEFENEKGSRFKGKATGFMFIGATKI